jgi:hypothetical protein
MRKKQLKWFTLVEVLIVLVAAGLLIGVLFKIYTTTAEISVRVKHQKQVWTAVVTMQTILQNIVDTHTIDYTVISWALIWWWTWAITTDGWTQFIPLIDEYQHTGISLQITSSGELLYVNTSGSASLLGNNVYLSGATFILSPLQNPSIEPQFSRIYHPWFWVIGVLSPYGDTKISFPVQTFFSLLRK